MAERIDQKSGMMHQGNSKQACDQEHAPGGANEKSEKKRHDKSDKRGKEPVIPVLPADHGILLKVPGIFKRQIGVFHEHPPDMGVKESLFDVVGISHPIHISMMKPVFRAPFQRGILAGVCTEEQKQKFDEPVRFIRSM